MCVCGCMVEFDVWSLAKSTKKKRLVVLNVVVEIGSLKN